MYRFNEDIDFTSHGFSSLGVFQGLIGISRFKSYEQWVFTSKVGVLRFKILVLQMSGYLVGMGRLGGGWIEIEGRSSYLRGMLSMVRVNNVWWLESFNKLRLIASDVMLRKLPKVDGYEKD